MKRRVLIIEDDPLFGQLFQEVLAGPGFTIRIVGTLRDAKQALRTWQPHLVLTDLHLPDGEGEGILRCLTARSAAFCLAMSGDFRPGEEESLRQAGAVACIDKSMLFDGDLSLLFEQA